MDKYIPIREKSEIHQDQNMSVVASEQDMIKGCMAMLQSSILNTPLKKGKNETSRTSYEKTQKGMRRRQVPSIKTDLYKCETLQQLPSCILVDEAEGSNP